MCIEVGLRADCRDDARAEVAPVAEVWRERRPDLDGAELEQAVTRSASEGGLDRAGERGRSTVVVIWLDEEQMAARSQRERRHRSGFYRGRPGALWHPEARHEVVERSRHPMAECHLEVPAF